MRTNIVGVIGVLQSSRIALQKPPDQIFLMKLNPSDCYFFIEIYLQKIDISSVPPNEQHGNQRLS